MALDPPNSSNLEQLALKGLKLKRFRLTEMTVTMYCRLAYRHTDVSGNKLREI